jgi:hypothetical protein
MATDERSDATGASGSAAADEGVDGDPLIDVRNLQTTFFTDKLSFER